MNTVSASALPASLHHYRLLWDSLVALRHPGMARRLKRTLPPLMALLILLTGLGQGAWPLAVEKSLILPVMVLVALGSAVLVPGAIAMNTPSHALLVPHLRQRLIRLVILFWVVSVPSSAWFLVAGKMGWWGGCLYVGLLMISICAARSGRFRLVSVPVQLAITLGTLYFSHLPAGLAGFIVGDAGLVAATVFMLGLAWLALRVMFPVRGNGNANPVSLASHYTIKEAMRMSGKAGRALYAASLRRASQGAAAPRNLLMHLFGPMGHWSLGLLSAAITVAVFLAVRVLLLCFAGAPLQAMVAEFSWTLALFFGPFGSVGGARLLLGHLHASKVEQSLMRLAPRFPVHARSFNRQLADGLLARSLSDLLFNAAALLLAVAILGGGASALWWAGATCALGLPLPCVLMRDFARSKDHGMLPQIGGFVLGAALVAALGTLASLVFGVAPPVAIVLAAPLVSAAMVMPRRRRVLAAPHAFPVERMA